MPSCTVCTLSLSLPLPLSRESMCNVYARLNSCQTSHWRLRSHGIWPIRIKKYLFCFVLFILFWPVTSRVIAVFDKNFTSSRVEKVGEGGEISAGKLFSSFSLSFFLPTRLMLLLSSRIFVTRLVPPLHHPPSRRNTVASLAWENIYKECPPPQINLHIYFNRGVQSSVSPFFFFFFRSAFPSPRDCLRYIAHCSFSSPATARA